MLFSGGKMNKQEILEIVKKIVLENFADKEADIYLFGSWAKKEERHTSDIDIGILGEKVTEKDLAMLFFQLEESIIPYQVDVVDLRKVNKEFYGKVKKEGILWKGCGNG